MTCRAKRHSAVKDSQMLELKCDLWFDITADQWPIVYCNSYNVRFAGLEKLHPFDAAKWGNIFKVAGVTLWQPVFNIFARNVMGCATSDSYCNVLSSNKINSFVGVRKYLKEESLVTEESVVKPREVTTADLLLVHTKRYLNSLKWAWNVATIAEIPPLAFVPNFLIQKFYLKPMRLQTGGSILAGRLALDRGWAINIGGGFHHCSANHGGGFCPYADITLLVRHLMKYEAARVRTAMIVDLDAHQGNGHERDFLGQESSVFILDVYNSSIYPRDTKAEAAISCKVKLASFTGDREYLAVVKRSLEQSLESFTPDVLVYNAGTDVLQGDGLGLLSVSSLGIIERDELVFRKAREHNIPIVMVTSGGYQKKTARIIADSILNLYEQGLICRP